MSGGVMLCTEACWKIGTLKAMPFSVHSLRGSADADRPYVGCLVEHADRAASVGVGSFTAQLVEAPSVAMAVVAKLLREAAGVEARAPWALHVDHAVVCELGAQVPIHLGRSAGAEDLQIVPIRL